MKWFSHPRRSFNSLNRQNRRRLGRATTPVVQGALKSAEQLEQRRLLTTYTGTANPDTFLIQVGGGNVTVTINGVPNIQSDAAVADIVINALGGADTITLINNTNNPTTINAADGDDSITIGGGDYDNNITSAVTITDSAGTLDHLTIDDTADGLGSDTYTMTVDRTLQKFASAVTSWAGINSVVVNGSNQVNTWDVNTDNGSGAVTLNGGSAVDTFNIGDAALDLSNNIDTSLFVDGNGGADVVTINDTAETSAATYTLDSNGLTSNLIGASIRVGFLSISSGTLNCAAGAIVQTFNILDLNGIASTTINAGDGNDTLNYGNGVADINTIDVNITFNGQGGTDALNYNSQTTVVLGTKTVTASTIDSAQHGILTHSGMEALVINLSGLNETLNFNSTPLTAQTTVNAGAGDDTITIGAGDFVTTVDENVTVNGGLGVDSLLIDDSLNAVARTWTLGGGSANASSDIVTWNTLGSDNVDLVSLLGGTGNDTFNKTASNSNSAMTVNGGNGNDSMFAGNGGNLGVWPGTAVFQGAGGADSLVIDDSAANTVAQTYTFSSDVTTLMTRTGMSGEIGFNSTTESVTLNTGTGGASALAQTVNVNAVAGLNTGILTLNVGDGSDTVNVGGGDWGQNIDRDVSVNGGAGNDRININDATNPDSDTYTHSAGTMVSVDAGAAQIFWDASVVIIDVAGTGFADSFVISSMRATDNISLHGGAGNDSLNMGTSPDDLDNTISGNLDFFGDADIDSITLNDGETADGPENYTISGSSFDKVTATFGSLGYTSATENLNFTLDDDASVITLGAFLDGQFVTVNGGLGNDTIQNDSSNNFSVDWEDVNLNLSGGGGTDSLDLDDSVSVAPAYQIDANFIQTFAFSGTGAMSAFYDLFENIILLAGSAGSTIDFPGADGSSNFTLNGGDGNDTINVGGPTGNDLNDNAGFNLVSGTISLIGGLGNDSLSFRDTDNEVGDDIYQLNQSNFVVGLGAANPITFFYNSDVDRMLISGSNLASRYDIETTFSTIEATITGGTANDTFNIAPAADDLDVVDANITVNGGAGNDSMNLQDVVNATAATWSITSTLITRTGGTIPSIGYGTLELIDINAGTAADTFNIASTASGTGYNLDGVGGNDVFNVASSNNMDAVDGLVTLIGNAGTDSLTYSDTANAAVTTYSMGGLGSQRITRTGAADIAVSINVETVTINTGSGNNVVNVNAWNSGFANGPTINTGAGNDSITVGNGDYDTNIGTPVTVTTGGGNDTLVFNDATDNDTGDTYTLTSSSITDSGAAANVLSYGAGASDVVVMNLPSGAETVNVTSSISGATTINGGGGNDTVNAGGGDLNNLNGTLTVNGDAGNDRFNLDNSTSLNNGTINFDAVSPTLGRITNVDVSPDDVAFFGNTTEFVVLNDGTGSTTFNVNSLPTDSGVSILGGLGNDTVNAGGGDIDLNLAAGSNVPNFNGGGGTDVLNFNDTADNVGGDNMTVLASQVQKNGQFVNYSLFESMNIAGSPQATSYLVESINATTPTSITGGGAADTFVVGNDIDAGILGAVTINGGGGTDAITFNDTGDTADADSYTFTDAGALDTFIKTGSATVSFNVEQATLDANGGNNPIIVNSIGTSLTLNGNSGNDNMQIADGGTTAAPIIVSSGAGADTVNVDSDSDAAEAVARFAGSDEIAEMRIGVGSTLLNAAGNSTIIVTTSFGFGGSFDIGSGFLIFRVGISAIGTYNTLLTNGYNAGLWNGASQAIRSSAANTSARADGVGVRLATDPNLAGANVITFGGQAVNPGDVLMTYTQNGDTDLDRDVDFDDLLHLAQNYNFAPPRTWTQGSFDYDNDVDFDDLLGLAQNYGLPFLQVSTGRTENAAARSALAEAGQLRGNRISRAMASLLMTTEKDDGLFAKSELIA
jgi:hypothetical protein